jgi:hypothetical protein
MTLPSILEGKVSINGACFWPLWPIAGVAVLGSPALTMPNKEADKDAKIPYSNLNAYESLSKQRKRPPPNVNRDSEPRVRQQFQTLSHPAAP